MQLLLKQWKVKENFTVNDEQNILRICDTSIKFLYTNSDENCDY